ERERGSHPVPCPPSPHVGTDGGDHPGELMAGNMRESPDVRIMPLPAVPVAPAQARRFHLNNHAVSRDDRVRNNRYTRRGSKRIVKKRTHVRILIASPPMASAFPKKTDKKKKRLQSWDNCKRLKFGGYLPHPGSRLTPFSGVNHLVSRCPTLSTARKAPLITAVRQNAKTH